MTVRYTAEAGMEETAFRNADRDIERWRDKVELRLDNRQVFFLFFGSAVVACMLFVLGVMVGKRIESRGQADAPEMQDPLAALDRAHQPPVGVAAPGTQQELTFPNTLIGPPRGKASSSRVAPAKLAMLAPPAKAGALAATKASAPAAVKPAAKPAAPTEVKSLPRSVSSVGAAAPASSPPSTDPGKGKGKYTLHIKTFATAEEANAFARECPGAFVIAGDVPGKGMAFRVRYGNYGSFTEAAAAKDSFEKQHKLIALVAAR
jgi:DedD protein